MNTHSTEEKRAINAKGTEEERGENLGQRSIVDVRRKRRYIQEWDPSQVLQQRREETPLAQSILEERVSYIADAWENDGASQENLETFQVESIKLWSETKQEIVQHRAKGGRCNSI